MKTTLLLLSLFLLSLSFVSCEKGSDLYMDDSITNPFNEEVNFNGFVFESEKYDTPKIFLEDWGENLDSLSSNYDLKITDGEFNQSLRKVDDFRILVHFDLNSPSLMELSEGVYTFENTRTRKPNNIVEAYIYLNKENKEYKYPILNGIVKIERENHFIKLEYQLSGINPDGEETSIEGHYTGEEVIIDQTSL